jgi:aspartokinase
MVVYTNVAGILSADPQLVPDAFPLPTLSFEEADTLLASGESLLHPQTTPILAASDIPLHVRSLVAPEALGILVSATASSFTAALALQRAGALISIKGRARASLALHLSLILRLITQTGIRPLMLHLTANQHLSLLVEEYADETIMQALENAVKPWEIRCQTGLAACLCAENGFTRQPLNLAYAVIALLGERIPVINQGFSDTGIVLIVRAEDGARAIRALHREFIQPVVPSSSHVHVAEDQRDAAQ